MQESRLVIGLNDERAVLSFEAWQELMFHLEGQKYKLLCEMVSQAVKKNGQGSWISKEDATRVIVKN